MTENEKKTLLDKIFEQTQRNQLKWQLTPGNSFRVDFPRSSIEIVCISETASIYHLHIFNNVGACISTITADLEPDADAKLATIFAKARSLALQVETTLQDILSGLDTTSENIRPGIYVVKFSAPSGNFGEGLAVIGDGAINGGDPGYIYRGHYQVSELRISASLKVTRWNPNVQSVFGTLPNFDLSLVGQIGAGGASITLEGTVPQLPNQRLRIDGRRLAETASPDSL
ncbi:MAG: hypothetical protein QOK24_931 [Verrucomicrobiota bacterium]|jgi:hypothetical protein